MWQAFAAPAGMRKDTVRLLTPQLATSGCCEHPQQQGYAVGHVGLLRQSAFENAHRRENDARMVPQSTPYTNDTGRIGRMG